MEVISKKTFLCLLKINPQSLISKQIIYDKMPQTIYDVSVGGDSIFLDKGSTGKEWYPADSVEDPVIIDTDNLYKNTGIFTVETVTRAIQTLEKHVGQPRSEQSKPLFDIVETLNKEVFELRLKFEEIEVKEKNYEPDQSDQNKGRN